MENFEKNRNVGTLHAHAVLLNIPSYLSELWKVGSLLGEPSANGLRHPNVITPEAQLWQHGWIASGILGQPLVENRHDMPANRLCERKYSNYLSSDIDAYDILCT